MFCVNFIFLLLGKSRGVDSEYQDMECARSNNTATTNTTTTNTTTPDDDDYNSVTVDNKQTPTKKYYLRKTRNDDIPGTQ